MAAPSSPQEPTPARPHSINPLETPRTITVGRLAAALWYAPITIHGHHLYGCVDSGSMCTIVNKTTYDKLPHHLRPRLEPSATTLRGIGATPTQTFGYALFPLELQNKVFYPT